MWSQLFKTTQDNFPIMHILPLSAFRLILSKQYNNSFLFKIQTKPSKHCQSRAITQNEKLFNFIWNTQVWLQCTKSLFHNVHHQHRHPTYIFICSYPDLSLTSWLVAQGGRIKYQVHHHYHHHLYQNARC